jgi:hypothetical protein
MPSIEAMQTSARNCPACGADQEGVRTNCWLCGAAMDCADAAPPLIRKGDVAISSRTAESLTFETGGWILLLALVAVTYGVWDARRFHHRLEFEYATFFAAVLLVFAVFPLGIAVLAASAARLFGRRMSWLVGVEIFACSFAVVGIATVIGAIMLCMSLAQALNDCNVSGH